MELHQALKQIAITYGTETLSDSKLIKLLDSLYAFDSIPYSMSIISTLISEGYIKRLIEYRTKGLDTQQLLEQFEEKTIFNIVAVERIWNSFIFALDELTNHGRSNESRANQNISNNTMPNQQIIKESAPEQNSLQKTFDLSYQFLHEWYEFISKLSDNEGVQCHTNNLSGLSIDTHGMYEGDGDTSTFRGKLFFLSLIDAYRCLEKIGERFDYITPPSFPFVMMLTKIYAQVDLPSLEMMYKANSAYVSASSILGKMSKQVPEPDCVFFIGHLIIDYRDNQSLYRQYLKLISDMIIIIDRASYGNPMRDKLKQVGISVLKLELLSKKINLN